MEKKEKCKCPFCENELEMSCYEPVFCEPCRKKINICKKCGKTYNAELNVCPECKEKRCQAKLKLSKTKDNKWEAKQ
ncbi:MAG: hypothetical protein KKH91_07400 [Elusimicrobia bacterium]|nr:hypothetical protein [Elusimicrobiota bacterium]MBU2614268.1 hypothetical protein [Elusimicrobiota bacterium]